MLKILVLGDRFITCETMIAVLEEVFLDSGEKLEYICYSDNWPVEPLIRNDEVSEFVGDEDEIAALASGVDFILTHSAPVTLKVLEKASESLKAVAAARGGPVNINSKACTERGIPIFYSAGSKGGAVAEFTVALMLAESRNLGRSHGSMMYEKKWRGDLFVNDKSGNEIGSSVVGLIGLGAIGKRVAQIVRGFGARVLVYDPYIKQEDILAEGLEPSDLDTLLKVSDFVSLHARLTNDSRGLLGAREMSLMKSSAILVNTARAELVDEAALVKALREKTIAGAGLDVFVDEPLKDDSPFYGLENVTIASHLGGASKQAAEIGAKVAVTALYQYITGNGIPKFCVNPEVLAK